MHKFVFYSKVFMANRPLVIAEIGTGHGADFKKAEELICAAVESGAECVKFQHVYADEILHPATGMVELPGGMTPLYEVFKSIETGPEFIARAKDKTEALGACFLCSPFGIKSARELHNMGVQAVKIASPELNHVELLQETASYKLPLILSSGVSRLSDIEFALEIVRREGMQTALLHCITAYPAPEEEFNLRLLPNLSAIFNVPTGLSDHSMDPLVVPGLAAALGAVIIEKHFCLSRSGDGLDDKIALVPEAFALMVKSIKNIAKLRHSLGNKAAIAELKKEYGANRIETILGSGEKKLAGSEEGNYERTRRSIHAVKPIKKGEVFAESNIAALRSEKVLKPGIHPRYLSFLKNRKAARDIPDGQGIVWDDIGDTCG